MSSPASPHAAAEFQPAAGTTRHAVRRVSANLPWQIVCDTLFGATLLAFCALTVYTGAVQTHTDGHDIFFFLDAGWRALHHQRPHVDFVSPWGPVIFLVEAAGLRLAGYSPDGVGYASALFGALAGAWAYLLARARMGPVFAWMCGVYVALVCMAPFPIGVDPGWSSHAMAYNRYGFALLAIIELECLQPAPATGCAWAGGLSTGMAAAIALFLKASYFFVALPFLAISVWYGDRHAPRWRAVAAGFAAFSLLFLAYLRFDLADMLADLGMAAASRPHAWSLSLALDVFSRNWVFGLLCPGAAALVLWGTRRAPQWPGWWGWLEELRPVVLVPFVFALGGLLIATNSQHEGLPLTAILCVIFLNQAFTAPAAGLFARGAFPALLIATLMAGIVWVSLAATEMFGLALGAGHKWRHPNPPVARFHVPRLARVFLFEPAQGELRSNGHTYVEYVNDGLRLLRENSGPADAIITMDMVNPFPYALQRAPMHGGIAAAAWNYCMNDQHHPAFDRLFGDAAVLLIPKRPAVGQRYFDGYVAAYRAGIDRRFRLAAESDWWWLYRRRTP